MELRNIAWVEKYRPNTVKNVVGTFKDKVLAYMANPSSMPHFLFYSRYPGTGKTTLAKAIIKDLGCDYLILNASDDRKIEVVREKVKDFVTSQSTNGQRRCVFLDEVDGMLKDPQNALRNLMETYSTNAFFILTCNNKEKIIDPIQSRCVVIEFQAHNKQDIVNFLEMICQHEKLQYNTDGLLTLVDLHYPSIRNCINTLQDLHISKLPVYVENISKLHSTIDTTFAQIRRKEFNVLKEWILTQNIDCGQLNKDLFNYVLRNQTLDQKTLFKFVQVLAKNERDMKLGADEQIIFIASLVDMVAIE